jgi:holo-[acyl-carrier protein] synthase
MPIRVGIDLTSVAGVRDSIDAHADHYLNRVYTRPELAECQTPGGLDAERLAARFAVKEATMKVLRPAEDDAVPWNTIEVGHPDAAGTVEIELSGRAAELATAAGLGELSASLTHEADYAAAVVVAELATEGGRTGG